MEAPPPNLEQLCAAEGLELVRRFHAASSTHAAHVRDSSGRDLFLKAGAPAAIGREWALLVHWRSCGATPAPVARPAPGVLVREFVAGTSLAQLGVEHEALVAAGRTLAAIHAAAPGAVEVSRARMWMEAEQPALDASPALAPGCAARAAAALAGIRAAPLREVLLHGDAYGRNLVKTGHRVVAIDPRGSRGSPAFDLACVAVMSAEHTIDTALAPLLEGYGPAPDGLEQHLVWLAVRAAARFRGRHGLARPPEHWQALLDSLG